MSKQIPSLHYFSEDKVSVGAECSVCHRVLKIYKLDLKQSGDEYFLTNSIICPCGIHYSIIESALPVSAGKGTSPSQPGPVQCPRCSSTQITGSKKGFGLGKAAGGAILLGPVGLLGGLIGSKKVMVGCLKCGHRWKP